MALVGPRARLETVSAPLAVPAAQAAGQLHAFRPGRASWPLTLAFALHDRAAGEGGQALGGHPPARLATRQPLGEQAIWHERGPDGGAFWVVGFAGKFWRPTRPLARPDWPGFVGWRAPGTARVAWQFALSPSAGGPARLTFSMVAGGVDRAGHLALCAYLVAVGGLSRRLRGALCRAAAACCRPP